MVGADGDGDEPLAELHVVAIGCPGLFASKGFMRLPCKQSPGNALQPNFFHSTELYIADNHSSALHEEFIAYELLTLTLLKEAQI